MEEFFCIILACCHSRICIIGNEQAVISSATTRHWAGQTQEPGETACLKSMGVMSSILQLTKDAEIVRLLLWIFVDFGSNAGCLLLILPIYTIRCKHNAAYHDEVLISVIVRPAHMKSDSFA